MELIGRVHGFGFGIVTVMQQLFLVCAQALQAPESSCGSAGACLLT